MKYYCKKCGSILVIPEGKHFGNCPVYGCNDPAKWDEEKMIIIPDYETPEQYKQRTGEAWPENGAVWFRNQNDSIADFVWGVCRYTTAKRCGDRDVVCVQGPNPPPDDWRPQ